MKMLGEERIRLLPVIELIIVRAGINVVMPRECVLFSIQPVEGLDLIVKMPLQKPHLYDEIKPFYRLYGKEDAFAWHDHVDPGTHNYQLDNRQQSYAFFTKHFHMPIVEREIRVDDEIKSFQELSAGLPTGNLTIVGLAKKIAAGNRPAPIPTNHVARAEWARSARTRLENVVRYRPMAIRHAWPTSSTLNSGIETVSYRFEFNNGLSATGVWLSGTKFPE